WPRATARSSPRPAPGTTPRWRTPWPRPPTGPPAPPTDRCATMVRWAPKASVRAEHPAPKGSTSSVTSRLVTSWPRWGGRSRWGAEGRGWGERGGRRARRCEQQLAGARDRVDAVLRAESADDGADARG